VSVLTVVTFVHTEVSLKVDMGLMYWYKLTIGSMDEQASFTVNLLPLLSSSNI